MRNTVLLAMVAFYAVACASGGQSIQTTPPAPSLVSAQADADEFRRELEEAYADILGRNDADAPALPIADLDAAASLTIPDHRAVHSAVRLFSVDLKDRIQRSFIRSAKYRMMIDAELERQKLPKALAYLPLIESAYSTTLTSKAGAHGLWQFMPATAREYGMRVDWWIDERADPELSTRAAARYLKDLHRMFGDWSLALAAYNCGPGRLRRTMEASGATTFWELVDQGLLPKETRGYVPTFFATIIIASDPASYGFRLVQPESIQYEKVDVAGPVSLAWIAESLGMEQEALQEINPHLRRGVVPPWGGSVRVPSHAARTLTAKASTLHEGDDHLAYTSFTLRSGDTIARLARSLGSSAETLLAMNGLKAADGVRAGDAIVLPVRARELGALLSHSNDENLFYAVQKGDTLYSIAKQNGLSVSELRELNELPAESVLRVGQKIRISMPTTLTAGGM